MNSTANIVSLIGECIPDEIDNLKSVTTDLINKISEETYQVLRALYNTGDRTFLTGMNSGFELLAAEMVLRLKIEEHSDIKLIAVIPFYGQELLYNSEEQGNYKYIYDNADEIIVLLDSYTPDSNYMKNCYLIQNSAFSVCYDTGLLLSDCKCNTLLKFQPVLNIHSRINR